MVKRKTKFFVFVILIALLALVCYLFYKSDLYRESFYPKKYSEYVREYASANQLDEHFIFAVIKTESGFDPDAVSDVGARGLMQLMPDAFDWVQFRIKEERDITYDDMFKPEFNIEYGTYLLGFLYQRYNSFELAAAAYHSGMTRVDGWLEDGVIDSENLQVNDIPSDVTRHYVNKIMNAYDSYNNLY